MDEGSAFRTETVSVKKQKIGTDLESVAARLANVTDVNADLYPEIRASTLNAQVYRTVREALLSGVLAPGDLLSSRVVATALGTSPMPVREALGRLMIEGALESTPNRAFRVPSIDLNQFRQVLLMRLRLETLASEHAATRIAPDKITRLGRYLEQLRTSFTHSAQEYLTAHRRFHFAIYMQADMPLVYATIETLWLRMGPLMNASSANSDFEEEHHHHQELFRAIERSDSLAASAAVQNDLVAAGRRTTAYLQISEAEIETRN